MDTGTKVLLFVNVYDTYQDVYEQLNKQQHQSQSQIYGHYQTKEAPRTKKTVRIQLPSDEREATEDEEKAHVLDD